MMDYWTVLAIALPPAGGSIAGSLIAERTPTPEWLIGVAAMRQKITQGVLKPIFPQTRS